MPTGSIMGHAVGAAHRQQQAHYQTLATCWQNMQAPCHHAYAKCSGAGRVNTCNVLKPSCPQAFQASTQELHTGGRNQHATPPTRCLLLVHPCKSSVLRDMSSRLFCHPLRHKGGTNPACCCSTPPSRHPPVAPTTRYKHTRLTCPRNPQRKERQTPAHAAITAAPRNAAKCFDMTITTHHMYRAHTLPATHGIEQAHTLPEHQQVLPITTSCGANFTGSTDNPARHTETCNK